MIQKDMIALATYILTCALKAMMMNMNKDYTKGGGERDPNRGGGRGPRDENFDASSLLEGQY